MSALRSKTIAGVDDSSVHLAGGVAVMRSLEVLGNSPPQVICFLPE